MSSLSTSSDNDRQGDYDDTSSEEESVSDSGDIEQYTSGSEDDTDSDSFEYYTNFVSNETQPCYNPCDDNYLCRRIVCELDMNPNSMYKCSSRSFDNRILMGDNNAFLISQALQRNESVRILDFQGIYFTLPGFTTLFEAVACRQKIIRFNLEGLMNDNYPVEFAQIQLLANKMKKNDHSFHCLCLDKYKIGWVGMITIFEALLCNVVLDTLYLANTVPTSIPTDTTELDGRTNSTSQYKQQEDPVAETIISFSNQVGRMVASVLQCNTTLKTLDLSYNPLDDDCIVMIADGLSANATLRRLYLKEISFSDVGVIALANSLIVNKTLEELNLSGNGFSKTAVIALGNALQVNNTLIALEIVNYLDFHIERNLDTPDTIDFSSFVILFKALEYNSTLRSLGIFDCDFYQYESYMSHDIQQSLLRSLEYNDTITNMSGVRQSAPQAIQLILYKNGCRSRTAPKKGGHNRRSIYNWLLSSTNF